MVATLPRTAQFNQETWKKITNTRSAGTVLKLIEGISMNRPVRAVNATEEEYKSAKMAHYQYGDDFTSKCLAITKLDPLPEEVIFLVTGELHRHNLKVEENLSDADALAAGQEESRWWIQNHGQTAREILEKEGIEVSIFTWQDFLNDEAFQSTVDRVRNDFYEIDPEFKNHIETLVEQNVTRALKRIEEQKLNILPKTEQVKTKKTLALLQKPITFENATDKEKSKIFTQSLEPIFFLFLKEGNSQLFLFSDSEVQKKLTTNIKTFQNYKPNQYATHWEEILETAQTIQSAYQAKTQPYENASRNYLLEEAASAAWIASLGGKNAFLVNTYKDKENPAWARAAFLMESVIAFIGYHLKKVKPSSQPLIQQTSAAPTQANTSPRIEPNRSSKAIAVPSTEESAIEEPLLAVKVLEKFKLITDNTDGKKILQEKDEAVTEQLFQLYVETIKRLPASKEKAELYNEAIKRTSTINPDEPELKRKLHKILGEVMKTPGSATPPTSPDNPLLAQAATHKKRRASTTPKTPRFVIRGLNFFRRVSNPAIGISEASSSETLFQTVKRFSSIEMLTVLQQLINRPEVITLLKEESKQDVQLFNKTLLECYMKIIVGLPEGERRDSSLEEAMKMLPYEHDDEFRIIIGKAISGDYQPKESTPPFSPNYHGESSLRLALQQRLGPSDSSRAPSPSPTPSLSPTPKRGNYN